MCICAATRIVCFDHISHVTGAILPNCSVLSDMRCYVGYWAHLWPCFSPRGPDREETAKHKQVKKNIGNGMARKLRETGK